MTSSSLFSPNAFKSILLFVLGIALTFALVVFFGIGWSDVIGLFTETPTWLLVLIVMLTVCNQLLGTVKWRLAVQALAPDAQMPGFQRMAEITTFGTFLSNFLPLPISVALTRWFWSSKHNRASGFVLRSTMFDQLFDFLVVLLAGAAGLILSLAGVPIYSTFAILFIILGVCVFYARVFFFVLARLTSLISKNFLRNRVITDVEGAFEMAHQSPMAASWAQSGLSFLRLQCLLLRVGVIVHFFAPEVDSVQLHVLAPAVFLVTMLPVTPGGLGLAEWSWGVFLIAMGANVESAALIAIAFRIFVVFELIVILSAFGTLRFIMKLGSHL